MNTNAGFARLSRFRRLFVVCGCGLAWSLSALDFTGIFPESVRCVSIVAPSSHADNTTVATATNELVKAGYKVKVADSVWTYSSDPKVRARAIEAAWQDPETDLILCARGGSGGWDTVQELDFDILKARDIPFVGFSNISVLNNAFIAKGVKRPVTGPMCTTLVNYPNTADSIARLGATLASAPLAPTQLDVRRAPSAAVTGKPVGGHWPSISKMDAVWLPDTSGRVVFLEVNSSYTLDQAKDAFDLLKSKGYFTAPSAIVLCDMGINGTTTEKEELRAYITDAVTSPVFSGYPYGHVSKLYAIDFDRELTIAADGLLTWSAGTGSVATRTVVIDPGDDVATNVLERFAGPVALDVNPTGAGLVRLNPANAHTGGVKLGRGTLVATGLAPKDVPSALGSDGAFTFGAGTLRYDGPSGVVFGLPVASGSATAHVLDAVHDLTLGANWDLSTGAFIKDGAGTVTVADGVNVLGAKAAADIYAQIDFKANGDAPTTGYQGLTVADGTLRLAGGSTSVGGGISVGVKRSADGSDACAATLEIADGVHTIAGNAQVALAAGEEAKGTLRITGGNTTMNGSIYVGPNEDMGTVWADFEMSGGTLTLPGNSYSLFIANRGLAHVRMDLSGGQLTVGKNFGIAYGAGSVERHVEIVIRDRGEMTVGSGVGQRVYFDSTSSKSTVSFVVKDGGRLNAPFICRYGAKAVYPDVLFDGGILHWRYDVENPFKGSYYELGKQLFVGTRGVTFSGTGSHSHDYNIPLVARDTHPGETPAGATFTGNATHVLAAAMSWMGPTRVDAGTTLNVKPDAGSLPEGTDLTVAGTFKLGASGQTVRDFTLNGNVNVYPGNPLTVTGTLGGSGTLNLYTAYGIGNPYVSTPGVYPLIRVPAARADELARFAQAITFKADAALFATLSVETAGEWATLHATLATPVAPEMPAADASGVLVVSEGDDIVLPVGLVLNASVDANPAAGQYKGLRMTGGSLSCATLTATDPNTEIALTGGLLEIREGALNPGNSSASNGAVVRLGAGATVRSIGIEGVSVAKGGTVYFDGGVAQILSNPNEERVPYLQGATFYVSAGGLVVDMSRFDLEMDSYINFKSPFLHDPALGETKDGGLTIYGGPLVDFGSGFRGSTFTGPVTVRDGGALCVYGAYSDCHDYVVRPTARIAHYDNTVVYANDMTLGETGATEPAVLQLWTGLAKGSIGHYVVSNDLQVLSPVEIWSANYRVHEPQLPTGAFTALVYRASCTVDPSLFVKSPRCIDRTMSVQEVTISGGAYDGWKAIVATITSKTPTADATWSAVQTGGSWDEPANWNGATPPNGAGAVAAFAAPAAAGVPVASGPDRTVTRINISGTDPAKGYAFSDPLTLAQRGTAAALVKAEGGTHTFAALNAPDGVVLTADAGALLDVAALTKSATVNGTGTVRLRDLSFATSASRLVVSGKGTLAYAGPDVEGVAMQVSANPFAVQVVDGVRLQTAVFTNTSTAAFIKSGTGTLVLGGNRPSAFAGLSEVEKYADAGDFGANGELPAAGYFSGNVAEGVLEIGVQDDPAQAPVVTLTKGGAVGIKASPAGASSGLVLNNGVLTGKDVYLGYFAKNTSVLVANFTVNGGRADLTRIVCGYVNGVSNKHRVAATIEVNGGELNLSNGILLGRDQRYNVTDADKALRHVFRQNGGTTRLTGGSFIAANSMRGVTAAGWVEVNGGVLEVVKGDYMFAGFTGDVSDLWLNGGEFRLGGDFVDNKNMNSVDAPAAIGPVDATLHFNGGLFRPSSSAATRKNNPYTRFLVEEGGAVVDTTDAGVYTFETDLSATNTVDGGLVKQGTGTLVLAGSNTYAGVTTVKAGSLRLQGDHALDGTQYLHVLPGAVLEMDGSASTVPRLRLGGLAQNGTLVVTDAFVCADPETSSAYVTVDGNLTVAPGVALDLGLEADAVGLASGTEIPLAVVSGAISTPGLIKARNAGARTKNFKLRVADGVLWASPSSGGTTLILR